MAEVFISYKSERRRAAEHLAEILRFYGFTVWFDYALIKGRDFGLQLDIELRQAKAVVVLWCTKSVGSRWVAEEVDLAHSLGSLVPVVIEPCDIPLGFRRLDYIDLIEWSGAPFDHKLDRFLHELEQRTGRAAHLDLTGMRTYEQTWRRFGAPSLRLFALDKQLEALDNDRKLPRRTVEPEISGNRETGISRVNKQRETFPVRAKSAHARADSLVGILTPRRERRKRINWDTILENTISNIVYASLVQLDPTNRNSMKVYIKESIREIKYTNASIPEDWLNDANNCLEKEDTDLYGTQSLGEVYIGPVQPVSVWVPVIALGALTVIYHAKLALRGLPPLNIHAGLPDALAIVARASGGWEGIVPPELIVTGDAPSLMMTKLEYGKYHIRLPMPPGEQRIVVSRRSKLEQMSTAEVPTKLKLSKLSISTPQVHMTKLFDRIDYKSDMFLDKISFGVEPRAAISEILANDYTEFRYNLWSPHWQLLTNINAAKLLVNTSEGISANHWYASFLMASDGFLKQDGGRLRRIEGQIRRSWLTLSRSETERRSTVKEMLSDYIIYETLENTCHLALMEQFHNRAL